MELSKMFGVERGEKFRVDGYCGEFMVKSQGNFERLYRVLADGDFDKERNVNVLSDIINAAPAGIIHLSPPLSDEQREQLKAIWTLGGRWLAKDADRDVYAYSVKPEQDSDWAEWVPIKYDEDELQFTVYRDLDVCGLVSWSDPEPFDIGKALGVGE